MSEGSTAPEQEVIDKSESSQSDSSRLAEISLSRRKFLKIAGLGALAGAAIYAIPATNYFGVFNTKREERRSEQSLEDRFGIEILSRNEAHDVFGRPPFKRPESDVLFDSEQLEMLEEFLPLFPKKFYSAHNGKKLNVASVTEGFVPGMKRGAYLKPAILTGQEDKPIMLLVKDFFQQKRKGYALRVLAHEFTHRDDFEFTDNKMWDEIVSTLGYESFEDFRDITISQLDVLPPQSPEAGEVRNWIGGALKGNDGKGALNPSEFIAVLGGAYVGGREDFDLIAEWIGQNTTNKLYDYIKEKVFDGREYNSNQRPAFLDKNSYHD